jgi:formylglycine-generating enzyme required for sulfatase activity
MTIICDICGNAYKDRHTGYRNGFICANCYNLGDIEELKNVVKLRIERTKKRLSVLEELGFEITGIKGKINSFEDKLLKDKENVPKIFKDNITDFFKVVSTDETSILFTLIDDKIPVLIDKNKLLTDQIKLFENLKGKDGEYEKEIEKLKKEIEGLNKKIDTLKNENTEEQEILAKQGNSIGMKFTPITAGEFNMGSEESDDEKPVHKVKIKNPFYLGTYPVTQREWKAVMGSNPSSFKGDDLPVEQVSWEDVQEFIKKLNEEEGTDKYRLPSEAEWEYAARAGTTTRYSFGDSESELGKYAWYDENSEDKTHPVGQRESNPWRLYDMHGNVWEWVHDEWHDSYDRAPTDGSAWESGDGADRVFRGGGWFSGAGDCRFAIRLHGDPRFRFGILGFRLLREK